MSSRSSGPTASTVGGVQAQGVLPRGESYQVQFEIAVRLVGMDGAGRDPDGTGRRSDPGAGVRGDGQHAPARVDDLVVVVPVRLYLRTGRQSLSAGGGPRARGGLPS
ncbi:hypothetical protein GCM10020295_81790 [Streptomyces cinereospinus]